MLTTRLLVLPAMLLAPLSVHAQRVAETDSTRSVTQAVSGVVGIGAGVFSFLFGAERNDSGSFDTWCFGPCERRANARGVTFGDGSAPFAATAPDAAFEMPTAQSRASQANSIDAPGAESSRKAPPSRSDEDGADAEALLRGSAGAAVANADVDPATYASPTPPWQAAPETRQLDWLARAVAGTAAPINFASATGVGAAPSFDWAPAPAPALATQQNVNVIVNPEPGTLLLLLAGLGTLAFFRLRRRPG